MRRWLQLCAVGVLASAWPPCPALAAPTSRMLVEMADISDVVLSPDGASVAFRVERGSVATSTYGSVWLVQGVEGEAPAREIADGGEPLRRSGFSVGERAVWSADSRAITFRALHGGEIQVWRAEVGGGGAEPITRDEANVRGFQLLADGGLIYEVGATRAAIAAAEQAEHDAGVRIDASVPIGQPLFRSVYSEGRFATHRYTGAWMDAAGLLADAPSELRVIDGQSAPPRDATDAERAAFAAATAPPEPRFADASMAASFREHAGGVAFLTPYGPDQTLRAAIPGEGETSCPDPRCRDIAWYGWSGDGRAVVFASADKLRGGAHALFRWDIDRGAVSRIRDMDGLAHGGRNPANPCELDDGFAICVTAAPNTPPRLERIELASGESRVLHDPNAALAAATGPEAELLLWSDDEGRLFSGQYYPASTGAGGPKPPLFITYYVCTGYVRGGGGDEWPLAALAEAGIAALCINHPRQDRSDASREGAAVTDYRIAVGGIRAALDVLEARGVDVTRVGMGGYSFGAEVTFWVAIHTDLLSAMSAATPMLSETYYLQRALLGEPFHQTLRRGWALGAPEETAAQWALIDPAHNLERFEDLPLLMQFPEQEYLSALDFFVPLLRSQAPADLYVFPGEPHFKARPRHKLAIYERNLDWFRFWLLGEEDPDPAKAAQLTRWRAMLERRGESEATPRSALSPASRL